MLLPIIEELETRPRELLENGIRQADFKKAVGATILAYGLVVDPLWHWIWVVWDLDVMTGDSSVQGLGKGKAPE